MTHITEKICRKCRQLKPSDAFYENKYSPDGLYAFCKDCFDRFAQKLKEKESASAPLKKTCANCGKIRLVDEFAIDPDTPEAQIDWCQHCRKQHETFKKKTAPPQAPHSQTTPPRKQKKRKSTEKSVNKPATGQTAKHSAHSKPFEAPAQIPRAEIVEEPADDFDYIEYLLERQALEEKLATDVLNVPKKITKIKARKRICNGCGKTEEIDRVEKNTVIPVRAWFCDICRQRSARRWVRKGTTIQDYWGREFKIKKIISNDLVVGVVKNSNGKWDKRSLKIYGNWKTGR